jgi:hypothetical protein
MFISKLLFTILAAMLLGTATSSVEAKSPPTASATRPVVIRPKSTITAGDVTSAATIGTIIPRATDFTPADEVPSSAKPSSSTPTCPAYQLRAPPDGVGRAVIGIDASTSTRGHALAALYEASADSAIEAAENDRLGIIIVAFNSASSSSQLVYADSFAASSGNSIVDQATRNRVRCQAERAVHQLLARTRSAANTGTDVGGNLAQLVALARPATLVHHPARVLALTDGLTEPSPSGGAHHLIDLRRLIDTGVSPRTIYRRYRSSFAIGNATGEDIAIKGIDRESDGSLSSTKRADALTQLWSWACRDAHSKTYVVTEEVP